ncbi:predicted protein [Naegleria gruberi]|uniref:Predicted protein n=1 Tax=Naegleria gruberi TaxID=5762 RepID=D2VYT2_NAEGR|nr:uncharacterized protein NAEGRDRAFT_53333 [Naegleria gruberi]EFC37963.1 predicted protein [Naegleria gruberi]|eukprot:XP_002670707.1 predicted protein [Naegleria gruberi strain NEG-M]
MIYENGLTVEKDLAEALEWYLKAGENGDLTAQVNLARLYRDGEGVEQDYLKSFEWNMKAAEAGDAEAQVHIGYAYDKGLGVEQDFSKSFEWNLKGAENGSLDGQFNVGLLLELGDGVEKNIKKSVFWKSKCFNRSKCFDFVEEPYEQFAMQYFTSNTEDWNQSSPNSDKEHVVVRFEEKDFTLSQKHLKHSKYLSTMMNSNWKDFNVKEKNRTILDLRTIQNDIFQEQTDIIQIFNNYVNYLTNEILPPDFDMKLKLIELSRYLQDDGCILNIVKEASILQRFYILLILEIIVEPIHIAITSCFAAETKFKINDLSENVIEKLLTQSGLSQHGKDEIYNVFKEKFNGYPIAIRHPKYLIRRPKPSIGIHFFEIYWAYKDAINFVNENSIWSVRTIGKDIYNELKLSGRPSLRE